MQYIMPVTIGIGIGTAIIVGYFVLKKFGKTSTMKILYFDTDKTCNVDSHDVKDGKVKIGKKIWDIAKENTFMLKEKGRIFPFLVLKHDSSKSVDVVSRTGTKGVKPEEMASLVNMSVLKQLLEPVGSLTGKFAIGFSIVMLILGLVIGIVLVSLGVISV